MCRSNWWTPHHRPINLIDSGPFGGIRKKRLYLHLFLANQVTFQTVKINKRRHSLEHSNSIANITKQTLQSGAFQETSTTTQHSRIGVTNSKPQPIHPRRSNQTVVQLSLVIPTSGHASDQQPSMLPAIWDLQLTNIINQSRKGIYLITGAISSKQAR
jgi:hypothetical protein